MTQILRRTKYNHKNDEERLTDCFSFICEQALKAMKKRHYEQQINSNIRPRLYVQSGK